MNGDGAEALRYHLATNHSLTSIRANRHQMVWNNQPRPYKLYENVPEVALPLPAADSRIPGIEAISTSSVSDSDAQPLTYEMLATLLHYSAGITRTITLHAGTMKFRAAACTGALYHIEIYAVTGQLNDLDAGIYQYGAHDDRLRRIRSGDYRSALQSACGGDESLPLPQAMLIYTSTYWRNSWKYQARAYRHAFWDAGTMLANTLALASAHEIQSQVLLGFEDDAVNHLLDLDDEREFAIAVVPIGALSAVKSSPEVSPRLELASLPYSVYEIPEPVIHRMHAASKLRDRADAGRWSQKRLAADDRQPISQGIPLPALDTRSEPIEAVIRRRGSARRFERSAIELDDLSAILAASTRGIPADVLRKDGPSTSSVYVIANAVSGLESGTYVYDPTAHALDQLAHGDFRTDAGYLDLGQELAADAAANIYILADLNPALATWGDRGYRVAQLEASIISGKLYLASYARNLAATGLTFFDDDVIQFFGPHAHGKSVMFLTAVGHRARRV
ncbi:MAG: SagB/ThcOx family dehydrogenase [Chloroflexota bacterium]